MSPKQFPAEVAERGAELFFDGAMLEPLGHNEALVMAVRHGSERAILRVTSHFHRTLPQVQAEAEFVEYLTANGYSAAAPLRSKANGLVERLNIDGNDYWVTASQFAQGEHVVAFSQDWNEELFGKWGAAIGKLHNLSALYDAPSRGDRWHWFEEPCYAEAEDQYLGEISRIRSTLEGKDSGGYGLMHGDFGRVNFLWTGGEVIAIDFDDCCHHHFLADVAIALWPLRGQSAESRARYLDWMLAGYFSERSEVDNLQEVLEDLFRLKSLSMYLYHKWLWDARSCTQEEMTWLNRLRESIGKPVWFY